MSAEFLTLTCAGAGEAQPIAHYTTGEWHIAFPKAFRSSAVSLQEALESVLPFQSRK